MIRYISGVKMLEDLDDKKIRFYEKALILIFCLLPIGRIFESFFPALAIAKEHSEFDKVENFIYVALIFVFTWLNKKIDDENVIERFLSLFVVATITSYIFLIPGSFILEFVLHRIVNHENTDRIVNGIMNFYTTCFVLFSLLLWGRKKQNICNKPKDLG